MYRLFGIFIVFFSLFLILPSQIYAVRPGIEAGAPYPDSDYITNLSFDTTAVKKGAGDNVPVTWADDNNLYSQLGECHGFRVWEVPGLSWGCSESNHASTNVVRVSDNGDPYTFSGVNTQSLFNGSIESGWGNKGRKGSGIVSINGTLYMLMRNWDRNGHKAGLAVSTDHGSHWTYTNIVLNLGYPTFLNFGKDYQGARDTYIYIYSQGSSDASAYSASEKMVLLRVPKDQITNISAYEYYSGPIGGPPQWSRYDPNSTAVFSSAVFRCPDNTCGRAQISYNPYIRRYLYWQQIRASGVDTRFEGGMGLYEAPEPWGPWKTVFYTKNWKQAVRTIASNEGPGEGGSFPTKWMKPDGTMYLAYSGANSFTVRKATVTLSGSVPPPTAIPLSPRPTLRPSVPPATIPASQPTTPQPSGYPPIDWNDDNLGVPTIQPTKQPAPTTAPPTTGDIQIIGIADGQRVSGKIFVDVKASFLNVHHIDFYVDGKEYNEEYLPPYQFGDFQRYKYLGFDTNKLSPGQHTLTVRVVLRNKQEKTIPITFTRI